MLLSCQYLGSRSPEAVKKKVLELIYSWTLGLPDEAKISDAYQMLKKQGKMALPFGPTPRKRSLFQLIDATGSCFSSLCPARHHQTRPGAAGRQTAEPASAQAQKHHF